jgi:RNA polymerase sigma-70 factor (ECF subfamily)
MAEAPGTWHDDPDPGGAETTRPSLLIRIRDAGDREAWQQFVDLYAPLIYGLARKRGLQDADAADVTQEVFRAVANRIARGRKSEIRGQKSGVRDQESGVGNQGSDLWEYDPKRGSFRSWLYTVTRHKISDSLGRKQARGTGDTATQMFLEEQPETDQADESDWQHKYQQRLFAWAAERIQSEFQESTWKAFWQLAVEGKSGEDVARSLDMSVGAVYVAKSRVLARLKKEIEELNREEEP